MHRFDAIIIGTGQAGPSLAASLAAAGMQKLVKARKDGVVDFLPEHLIVVGGSYVGLEFGQILGVGGDEVVHSLVDAMYGRLPYDLVQHGVRIHPTVSELTPTALSRLQPVE